MLDELHNTIFTWVNLSSCLTIWCFIIQNTHYQHLADFIALKLPAVHQNSKRQSKSKSKTEKIAFAVKDEN